jgi:hypothetical protein
VHSRSFLGLLPVISGRPHSTGVVEGMEKTTGAKDLKEKSAAPHDEGYASHDNYDDDDDDARKEKYRQPSKKKHKHGNGNGEKRKYDDDDDDDRDDEEKASPFIHVKSPLNSRYKSNSILVITSL